MCGLLDKLNPFGGSSGGSAAAQSSSTAAQSSTVNVATNIDTRDVAKAIAALAGANVATGAAQAHAALTGQAIAAAATVQAAQITAAAQSSQSVYIIGGAIIAALGLLFTAGIIKVPRALRA